MTEAEKEFEDAVESATKEVVDLLMRNYSFEVVVEAVSAVAAELADIEGEDDGTGTTMFQMADKIHALIDKRVATIATGEKKDMSDEQKVQELVNQCASVLQDCDVNDRNHVLAVLVAMHAVEISMQTEYTIQHVIQGISDPAVEMAMGTARDLEERLAEAGKTIQEYIEDAMAEELE